VENTCPTRMVKEHTGLSVASDVSSFTNNTEVSNTNNDGLMDTDDSKVDYEYEVSNCYRTNQGFSMGHSTLSQHKKSTKFY
jgi:hypothetical protein